MELNADLRRPQVSGQRPRKMDEIIMARCLSTVGEPHSEILHAPHLFFNIKLNLIELILFIYYLFIYSQNRTLGTQHLNTK